MKNRVPTLSFTPEYILGPVGSEPGAETLQDS